MELAWKKLSEEPYKAGYRKLVRRQFQFPNGRIEDFDLYHDGDVATALVLTPDRQVVTAKQFRPGPEQIFNELIGGFINPGEEPVEAVQREILEESGYVGQPNLVGTCYFSAYSTGKKHIFVIQNSLKAQESHLEDGEYIEIELLPVVEFKKRALAGRTTDLDAILLALHHLGEL